MLIVETRLKAFLGDLSKMSSINKKPTTFNDGLAMLQQILYLSILSILSMLS